MANLLKLAKDFTNLGIVGSITPAGALMAIAFLLGTADSTSKPPPQTLLSRFTASTEIDRQLHELREKRRLADCRLREAQQRVRVAAGKQGRAQAELANATALRDGVRAVHLNRWQNRHALRHEAESRLQGYQDDVDRLSQEVAGAERRAAQATADEARHSARLESLNADIDSLREQRIAQAPMVFAPLFNAAWSILLLGWLIGIVLNPVNKWLLGPLLRLRPTPDPDPLYLIGKNVITQEDYDFLVRRYHRFAQIAASLILPVLALGFVLCKWYWPWNLVAVIVAAALSLLARRRNDEFHKRVARFINGRLCFIHTQKQEAERKEHNDQLVALTKAIAELATLLKLAKCCGDTKCKRKPDSCQNALTQVVADVENLIERAKSCYPPKCSAKLDSSAGALKSAIAEAVCRLQQAQSACCSECRPRLNSCGDALIKVTAEAERLLKLARSCCCSKCKPSTESPDSTAPEKPE